MGPMRRDDAWGFLYILKRWIVKKSKILGRYLNFT